MLQMGTIVQVTALSSNNLNPREDAARNQQLSESSSSEFKPRWLCTSCGKSYSHRQGLNDHMRMVHRQGGGPRYNCSVCHKAFMSSVNYRSHLNSHQKLTPYGCRSCNRKYQNQFSLRRHAKVCGSAAPAPCFECHLCGKKFLSRQYLNQHMQAHQHLSKFRCLTCFKTFKHQSSLFRHRKLEEKRAKERGLQDQAQRKRKDEKRQREEKARRAVEILKELDEERENGTKGKGRRIEEHREAVRETKRAVNDEERMTINEDRINGGEREVGMKNEKERDGMEGVKNNNEEKDGMEREESVNSKEDSDDSEREENGPELGTKEGDSKVTGPRATPDRKLCMRCGKTYTGSALTEHLRGVHGIGRDKRHICPVCDKGFMRKACFHSHMNFHYQLAPYECDKCGKAFRIAYSLDRHRKMCVGTKDSVFQCPECPRTFGQKYLLKLHSLSHDSVAQFECQHCQKRFKQKPSLCRHIKKCHLHPSESAVS